MKRSVGFDVNGWSDFAAQNWPIAPSISADSGNSVVCVKHGGNYGSVISIGDSIKSKSRFVGGIQAEMAPQGLGRGWKTKIDVELERFRLVDLLKNPSQNSEKIAAAISSMADASGATMVLAIQDCDTTDESKQDDLLSCLRRLRPSKRLLVWRSVLAVLSIVPEHMNDPTTWKEGQEIGVVGHDSAGFVVQSLTLRRKKFFAPERKQTGLLFDSKLGLKTLLETASKELLKCCADNSLGEQELLTSKLPVSLALGIPCKTVPLRAPNGDWKIICPPATMQIDSFEFPSEIASALKNCDTIIFESPTQGEIRETIVNKLRQVLIKDIIELSPCAVARGALVAARRLASSEPIYYDFLPQLSTIVLKKFTAKNFDLIPPETLLPAGKRYRSEQPARLMLAAGAQEIKIHLKKQDAEKPRLAIVSLSSIPRTNVPTELYVEQIPASGRAIITLDFGDFCRKATVNWDRAEKLDKDWEDLIEELMPQPTIPRRLILQCSSENWMKPWRGTPGLKKLLENELAKPNPDWSALAAKLSSRPSGYYPLSSDGEFPEDLPNCARSLLERAIEKAECNVARQIEGSGAQKNDALKFLTWSFQKCPEWIASECLRALKLGRINRRHGLVYDYRSRTLLLQGIGRVARSREVQREAFDYLLAIPKRKWKKNEMACAAFMLSRTDSAPELLKRNEAYYIADVACLKVLEAVGRRFTSKYSYGPFLLVGILRWRLNDARALVAGFDPVADKLLSATQELVSSLDWQIVRNPSARLESYRNVLNDVCDELNGQGKNPDIFIQVQQLTAS